MEAILETTEAAADTPAEQAPDSSLPHTGTEAEQGDDAMDDGMGADANGLVETERDRLIRLVCWPACAEPFCTYSLRSWQTHCLHPGLEPEQ